MVVSNGLHESHFETGLLRHSHNCSTKQKGTSPRFYSCWFISISGGAKGDMTHTHFADWARFLVCLLILIRPPSFMEYKKAPRSFVRFRALTQLCMTPPGERRSARYRGENEKQMRCSDAYNFVTYYSAWSKEVVWFSRALQAHLLTLMRYCFI